jgi:hypothetical protein
MGYEVLGQYTVATEHLEMFSISKYLKLLRITVFRD